MPKFNLVNTIKFLYETFTDLQEAGELEQDTTFADFYTHFKAEIAEKSLNSDSEFVKATCLNLCYLVDRIRFNPAKNQFLIGQNKFGFLSCVADNKMEVELCQKGEQFFLDNLNNYRATKTRTQVIKRRKGLSCRKKKYSVEVPLPPLKVEEETEGETQT